MACIVVDESQAAATPTLGRLLHAGDGGTANGLLFVAAVAAALPAARRAADADPLLVMQAD